MLIERLFLALMAALPMLRIWDFNAPLTLAAYLFPSRQLITTSVTTSIPISSPSTGISFPSPSTDIPVYSTGQLIERATNITTDIAVVVALTPPSELIASATTHPAGHSPGPGIHVVGSYLVILVLVAIATVFLCSRLSKKRVAQGAPTPPPPTMHLESLMGFPNINMLLERDAILAKTAVAGPWMNAWSIPSAESLQVTMLEGHDWSGTDVD